MPGSGKQPPEVQERIKELLEAGFDPTTIHNRLKVGRSSIYRMKRSLQQYGSAYAPPETNKKNGRPKVLTPEQELVIRDWLRAPANRNRYLDDLVWFIHDKFGVVCSTTTVSKMKRKWLRVIEDAESSGHDLPDVLSGTLANEDASPSPAIERQQQYPDPYAHARPLDPDDEHAYPPPPAVSNMQQVPSYPSPSAPAATMQIQPDLQQHTASSDQLSQAAESAIDVQLQQQIQREIAASADSHG